MYGNDDDDDDDFTRTNEYILCTYNIRLDLKFAHLNDLE